MLRTLSYAQGRSLAFPGIVLFVSRWCESGWGGVGWGGEGAASFAESDAARKPKNIELRLIDPMIWATPLTLMLRPERATRYSCAICPQPLQPWQIGGVNKEGAIVIAVVSICCTNSGHTTLLQCYMCVRWTFYGSAQSNPQSDLSRCGLAQPAMGLRYRLESNQQLLEDWLEYHQRMGVQHWTIYDLDGSGAPFLANRSGIQLLDAIYTRTTLTIGWKPISLLR